MILWVATGNKGKAKEFLYLLKEHQIYFLKDLPDYKSSKETGFSFEENARIKAKDLKKIKPKQWVLGEDSGLEVPALNNAPGVFSARYAGPKATDMDNLNLLLSNMKGLSDHKRVANFISCIIALSPEGKEYFFQGKIEGYITTAPIGTEGFGYDPVFIPRNYKKSLAELGIKYKNRFSHRAQAVNGFLKLLNSIY